jgi:diguanylate cyclase (GGDEF)-like protein
MIAGAADYIRKPFHGDELRQRLSNALSLTAARRQLRDAEVELVALRATDPLTGLGNFQRLRAVLDYEYGRATRYHRPLACAVLADDSLDALLSERGRQTADEALRELAHLIRAELREVDRVFRVDMAEFFIILPETLAAGARAALDRIVASLVSANTRTGAKPVLSAAFACYPHPDLKRAEDLFLGANLALAGARKLTTEQPAVVEFTRFDPPH